VRGGVNRLAKIAVFAIVGIFLVPLAVWWFTIGEPRREFDRSYKWVREIGASVLGGHGVLSGVDFGDVKPEKLKITDLKRLSGFRELEHIRIARRTDGDAFVMALMQLRSGRLRSFSFFDVRLGESAFVAIGNIAPKACKDRYLALDFWRTPVPAAAFRRLRDAPCDITLGLREVALDYEEFAAMAELPRLRSLKLYQISRMRPSDVAQIRRMPLINLSLIEVPLGEELSELSGMLDLRSLSINGREFDDTAGRHLNSLPNLSRVELHDTQIGNATLSALGTLPKLTEVFIWNTRVTDEGLLALARAPMLRWVLANRTAITPEGVSRAQQIRPELKVRVERVR
jgi:hypothetical protein